MNNNYEEKWIKGADGLYHLSLRIPEEDSKILEKKLKESGFKNLQELFDAFRDGKWP